MAIADQGRPGRTVRMLKSSLVFALGTIVGAVGLAAVHAATSPSLPLRHPLQVRLHRVVIKDDQLSGYADWQRFLHREHAAAVATLDREHMFVEAMFRDTAHDPHTLYWLEVRDDAGAKSNDSNLEIDREHERYMHQVLRSDSWSILTTENVLVAPFIDNAIARSQADADHRPH